MRDVRDLLSATPHVERIVFSYDQTHTRHTPVYREEMRTHYYIGSISGDRVLLLGIPSIEGANEPVDLLKLDTPTFVAHTSDTDFRCHYPIVTPRPRPVADPNFERSVKMLVYPLMAGLQLGLTDFQPGTLRWEGDRFRAEFTDEIKNRKSHGTIHFGKPGEVVPESVKEKFLADLLNPPENRPKGRVGYKDILYKEVHTSRGPLQVVTPTPGSVEAKIQDFYIAKHEAEMARGFKGELIRDEQGNVFQIRFELRTNIHGRVELKYFPTVGLPAPFPHRIQRFLDLESESGPMINITIYSVKISDQPVDEAVFVPWQYLKEGTYVRGRDMGNERSALADPKKDHALFRQLLEKSDKRFTNGGQVG
jgi:hypothetical protein